MASTASGSSTGSRGGSGRRGRYPPENLRRLLAGLLLFARHDAPGVADVAPIPAREGPVRDDLGVHDDLDEGVEQGDGLEAFELVVADLAQLGVSGLAIGDLQEVFPHLVDLIGLKDVSDALADVEDGELRLDRLLRRRDRPEIAAGFALLQLGP